MNYYYEFLQKKMYDFANKEINLKIPGSSILCL